MTSTYEADSAATRLGRAIAPAVRARAGMSGIFALVDAHDAFAARALLAAAAERTLDVQYYIWHDDLSGRLLLEALHRAADRGVRVRLLLDDNNTAGLDPLLAALDVHPRIEVRLFNPFVQRRWRWLGYLTDFERLNRRMHNKSFTADNQATIVGGRNVGDEYFAAGDGTLFVDLDVMAVGPIVDEVSRDFDRYWASGSAYPASVLLQGLGGEAIASVAEAAAQAERDPAARAYVEALASAPFVRDLLAGTLALDWATARLVSDDPAKGQGRAAPAQMLPQRLKAALGDIGRELLIVSPYFVPTADGVEALSAMARSGVRVQVLTNALEATDVALVHAGYARWRRELLQAGVALYEMRRASLAAAPGGPRFMRGGSSAASLHAKTFTIDGARLFVGSFNFDPRSAELNTEMGVVIDSAALAGQATRLFAHKVPAMAYELRLSADGGLRWIERSSGRELVHDVEPGTSWLQRVAVRLLSLLPIERLL